MPFSCSWQFPAKGPNLAVRTFIQQSFSGSASLDLHSCWLLFDWQLSFVNFLIDYINGPSAKSQNTTNQATPLSPIKTNPIFGNLRFDCVCNNLSLPVRPHETGHTLVCPRRCPAPLPRVDPVPPAGPLSPAAPLCPPPGHKCAKSSRQAGSPCQPASVNSRALTTRVYFPRGGNSVYT